MKSFAQRTYEAWLIQNGSRLSAAGGQPASARGSRRQAKRRAVRGAAVLSGGAPAPLIIANTLPRGASDNAPSALPARHEKQVLSPNPGYEKMPGPIFLTGNEDYYLGGKR